MRGILDAAAKPVGDRGKKELPIKKVDLATFVISFEVDALNFVETITLRIYYCDNIINIGEKIYKSNSNITKFCKGLSQK